MSKLAGRVVVVTGASAGIGRDTAERLRDRGAVVVGAVRDRDRLRQLEGIDAVRCDVAVAADRAAPADDALATHGRLDALVTTPGSGGRGRSRTCRRNGCSTSATSTSSGSST